MDGMQGWTFDARTVAPQVSIEPVPEGWYKVYVEKSNFKPSRTNPADRMLELQCKIMEGQYQNRILFWNFNLFHTTSQQTVEIAYKQLSAVSYVTGQFMLSAQPGADNVLPMLHNIPFYVHAVVGQGNQGPINNIRGVKDINGNEPGKGGQGPGPQQPAPPVGPAAPAWGAPPPAPSSLSAPGGYAPPPAPPGAPPAPAWGTPPAAPPGPAPAWGAPPPAAPPASPPGGGWQSGPAPAAAPPGPQQPAPQWGPPAAPPAAPPQQQWQPPGQGQPGGPPPGAAPWGR